MTFKTIHTNYGLQRMAAAEAAGTPINLVAMAVGDGNGNPTAPSESQTVLVREIAGTRAAPNRIYQSPDNPLMYIAELVVPASLGGFTIRESGIFDADGGLFAVANVPATYKPAISEGAFADTVIRMQFLVSNASVVTLQVDPNVAVATQSWIANNVTIPYLLPGGTTGQYLAKQSNANGDTHWVDPTVANVTVSTVDEVQTLAAAQTAVTLAVCTTIGLAVYVAGDRLLPSDWTPDPVDHTKLTLATSYAAGTKIHFVQNDPAAFVPSPLIQSQNLADVPDKSVARTNLDVYSRGDTDARSKQPGDVFHTARDTAPARSLKANGAAVSRTAYAALFAAVGTRFGAGDGFNTFNLPDLRGEFIRSWDDGRGADGGRSLGSAQAESFKSHGHAINDPGHGHSMYDPGHSHGVYDPGHSHDAYVDVNIGPNNFNSGSLVTGVSRFGSTQGKPQAIMPSGTGVSIYGSATGVGVNGSSTNISLGASGGSETRPRNVALLACIAY